MKTLALESSGNTSPITDRLQTTKLKIFKLSFSRNVNRVVGSLKTVCVAFPDGRETGARRQTVDWHNMECVNIRDLLLLLLLLLIISWPFIFSLLLALTVRFLTKRFIGEYQSIMREYINFWVYSFILNIVQVFSPHSHGDDSSSNGKSLPFSYRFIHCACSCPSQDLFPNFLTAKVALDNLRIGYN